MKTLTVTNQKGGVGKTALLVNFALRFAEHNLAVAVVDLDIQGNCSFTLSDYVNEHKIFASDLFSGRVKSIPGAKPGITLFPGDTRLIAVEEGSTTLSDAVDSLRGSLIRLADAGYQVCLLDSPAAPGIRFMSALLAAGFILAPIELEAYSIQGIGNLVRTVANVRKANPDATFLGMIANKVDRRSPRHSENLQQLREAYPELLLPMTIGLRGSIAEALVRGEPVWHSRKTAARMAAREIKDTADYIYRRMGLANESGENGSVGDAAGRKI